VNAVGVDVNLASAPLLARVSGLSTAVAESLVAYRDSHGQFQSRLDLRQVPRFGEKTFEQAAGFLRVMNGSNPLDSSAVHPESYPLVEKILAKIKKSMKEVLSDPGALASIQPELFVDTKYGMPTIVDVLKELEKPGRDPRPEFTTAAFKEGIEKISDLSVGMVLEGIVTNVAAFGAFVDIGVHQDGLVHISALSDTFVKDPHAVVKAGQVVRVKVLELDEKRKRIALTMRLNESSNVSAKDAHSDRQRTGSTKPRTEKSSPSRQSPPPVNSAMAAAFGKLGKK
jgi:uncharacterized protein